MFKSGRDTERGNWWQNQTKAEEPFPISTESHDSLPAGEDSHRFRSGTWREPTPLKQRALGAARTLLTKRNLAWTLLAVMVVLTAHTMIRMNVSMGSLWSTDMLLRMLVFAALYGCGLGYIALEYPDKAAPALATTWFFYSAIVGNPLAPPAVLFVLWSSYCVGALILGRRRGDRMAGVVETTLLGLAVWIYAISVTAHFAVHHWYVYVVALAAPIGVAAYRKLWLPRLPKPPASPDELADFSVVCLPLTLEWLSALKPEVGRDALAIHTVVPSRMASQHFWPFDVTELLWAVKPMGAEWGFTMGWMLGGEPGARLLNWAVFALTCRLLYELLRGPLAPRPAALLTAAFASTPMMMEVTGSLHPEATLGALLLGSVTLLRLHLKWRDRRCLYGAAFAAGVSATCTTSAPVYPMLLAIPALPLLAWRWKSIRVTTIAVATGVGVAAALVPLVRAWAVTGNPLFPYASGAASAALLDTGKKFVGDAVHVPLSWTTWFDLSFRPEKFMGGAAGSLGLLFFVLAPFVAFLFRRLRPALGLVLAWVAAGGIVVTLMLDARMVKIYPALLMLAATAGMAIASLRMRGVWFQISLECVAFVVLAVNLLFLPSFGSAHRDVFLNQLLNRASERRYVEKHAPERRLLEDLELRSPGASVALLESNAIGAYPGKAVTNSWHSAAFYLRLQGVRSVSEMKDLARAMAVEYVIAPAASSAWPMRSVYTRRFADTQTLLVARAGEMELRQITDGPVANAPAPAVAKPGEYDEVTAATEYGGAWTRDMNERRAANGTLAYSSDPAAQVLIRFQGTAITLRHTGAANRCEAEMVLDGGDPVPFFENYDETKWRAEGPRILTAQGEHTLLLRMPRKAQQMPGPMPCYLDLDGFAVE